MVQDFDVLLLDEPTNHLDNEMLTWLEDYLNRYKGTVIMVTHDRYFLDRVSNRILELDHGKIYSYEANVFKISGAESAKRRDGTGNGAKKTERPSYGT